MNRLSRSTALKIAAVLSFSVGLFEFIFFLPYVVRGATDITQDATAMPYGVILIAFVLAILRIVAAYGAWKDQRWGIVITLIVNAIDAIFAMPGLLFAPSMGFQIGSIVVVVLSILTCALSLWRDRKATTA